MNEEDRESGRYDRGSYIRGRLSRSAIDVAVGVLVSLRRCSEREAFNEIANSVHRTGIGLGTISRALVALASGTTEAFDHRNEVVQLWGELLTDQSPVGSTT